MGHVFVRLAGHGARLVPYWPYRFAGGPAQPTVEVTVFGSDGGRRAVVGPGTAPVPGVVDVDAGPQGDWRLEVGPFSLCWPPGFHVESPADAADSTPCYLLGPDETVIFPQGPVPLERLAAPDALVAPGQRVVDRRVLDDDIDVVELAYVHDGAPWRQAYWVIPVGLDKALVLTGQAPEAAAPTVRAAGDRMAATVTGVPA
ncbi:hypothetical protein ONA91_05490 [Micromonospora sp. DR5-3]|uniref:hypothetical protein n=1 Tax=unclassified Micromonospora TaxID=2617518 RepID=UPI0011DA5D24|nr:MULTISPECIES: hypothetical protein [unclassified Micromonospora]MCW3813908.1 hypothetical protein [Micromonospora sp. DR5-3]TYC24549.1 hypothetical protein FXF52_09800 [Micromonospora sp. MP36]